MKYYKKNDDTVWAFDDTQDHLVTDEFTPMTPDEVDQHLRPPIKPWLVYQHSAKMALVATDEIAIRYWKAGIPYPPEWQQYTQLLRQIVNAADGDHTIPLPTKPPKPDSI